jgi:hypothetical protein
MHEVDVAIADPRLLWRVVAAKRVEALLSQGEVLRRRPGRGVVITVHSTATGGKAAEVSSP